MSSYAPTTPLVYGYIIHYLDTSVKYYYSDDASVPYPYCVSLSAKACANHEHKHVDSALLSPDIIVIMLDRLYNMLNDFTS